MEIEARNVASCLRAIRALPVVKESTIFGQTVHAVIDAKVTDEELTRELASKGHVTESIRSIVPSLEDVFVSLTRVASEERTLTQTTAGRS